MSEEKADLLKAVRNDLAAYTVTLPEQRIVRGYGDERCHPAVDVTFTVPGYDSRQADAINNALALLKELYSVGLYDPLALRVLLTAHGHRPFEKVEGPLEQARRQAAGLQDSGVRP